MKLSTDKSSMPCRKQVFRTFAQGEAMGDVIATDDEELDGVPLLTQVMRNGQRLPDSFRSLDEIRSDTRDMLLQLPSWVRAIETSKRRYPVEISERLQQRIAETRALLESVHV